MPQFWTTLPVLSEATDHLDSVLDAIWYDLLDHFNLTFNPDYWICLGHPSGWYILKIRRNAYSTISARCLNRIWYHQPWHLSGLSFRDGSERWLMFWSFLIKKETEGNCSFGLWNCASFHFVLCCLTSTLNSWGDWQGIWVKMTPLCKWHPALSHNAAWFQGFWNIVCR